MTDKYKSSIDVINEIFYNVTIILKDRGNRGYYIRHYYNDYSYM